MTSLGLQQHVRRQALTQIIGIVTRQLDSMAEIREPTRALRANDAKDVAVEHELYPSATAGPSAVASVENLEVQPGGAAD